MLTRFRRQAVSVTDKSDWVNKTEALYKYLRRDHEPTLEALQNLYPDTWDQRVLRVVPFLQRLARTLGTLYQQAPTRDFVGAGVNDEVKARIGKIYKSIGVNDALRTAQEQLTILNNSTVWVFPTSFGGVRLLNIPPHDQEFKSRDPWSNDVRDLEEAYISLPVGSDLNTGFVTHAVAKITPEEAVWVDGPKGLAGTGVWGESTVNPLGRIPVVAFRGSEPASGEFFAPVPYDLLHAQLALDLTFTDIQHIASLQGYGQPVIKGVGSAAATELKLGPESVIGLPDGEGMEFTFEHGNPPLAEYQNAADQYLRSVLAFCGVNPDIFLKTSGAISAVAKRMDMHERELERGRFVNMFERAEQDLWDLVRMWINELRGNGREVYPETDVRIRYHFPDPPVDPLHREQATRLALDSGLTSPGSEYARRHGVTEAEAQKKVNQNLQQWAKLQEINNPDRRIEQGRTPDTELRIAVD